MKKPFPVPAQPDSLRTAQLAWEGADAKLATDPVLLAVADVLAVIDLFLIVSARNERQIDAIAEEVHRVVFEGEGRKPVRREGTLASGWVLLDYGDVVVHIFHEDQRSAYDLERLWADVPHHDPVTLEIVERHYPSKPDTHDVVSHA